MASHASFCIPSSHDIELWRLNTAVGHEDPSLAESLTPSQRRPSITSFSSAPGLSPASSIIKDSRPTTPSRAPSSVEGSTWCVPQALITPERDSGISIQCSPFRCQLFSDVPQIGSNLIPAHSAAFQTYGHEAEHMFKLSTPVRPRPSFVSDTSSFPSPASCQEYPEDILDQAAWNPVAILGGNEYGTDISQENDPLLRSFDTTWNSEFLSDQFGETVKPSDILTPQGSFSYCNYGAAEIDVFTPAQYGSNDLSTSGSIFTTDALATSVQEYSDCEIPDSPERAPGKSKAAEEKRCRTKSRNQIRSSARSRAQRNLSSDETTYVSKKFGKAIEVTYKKHSEIPLKKVRCDDPQCKAMFGRGEHARRHHRTHTGERPFVCALGCNQKCSRSDNSKDHYLTHLKRGGRNKGAEKLFLFWLIRQYEPERAQRLIKQLEDTLVRKNIIPCEPDPVRHREHPDWGGFQEWLKDGGTLAHLRGEKTMKVTRSKAQ